MKKYNNLFSNSAEYQAFIRATASISSMFASAFKPETKHINSIISPVLETFSRSVTPQFSSVVNEIRNSQSLTQQLYKSVFSQIETSIPKTRLLELKSAFSSIDLSAFSSEINSIRLFENHAVVPESLLINLESTDFDHPIPETPTKNFCRISLPHLIDMIGLLITILFFLVQNVQSKKESLLQQHAHEEEIAILKEQLEVMDKTYGVLFNLNSDSRALLNAQQQADLASSDSPYIGLTTPSQLDADDLSDESPSSGKQ